jgi:dimeric dUTPase (all-alpha-NTP-PPase superfamily)
MSEPSEEENLMATIMQVNEALEAAIASPDNPWGIRGPVISRTAVTLGWEISRLERFVQLYGPMLCYQSGDVDVVIEADPHATSPPNHIPSGTPTDQQLADMVSEADANLKFGLKRLKLSDDEAEIAVALAEFNGGHFMESSGMISAQVLQTALKLGTQQRQIEERLRVVREEIANLDKKPTVAREQWVQEERMLSYQYIDIGRLLTDIQANWYKGAAQLALMKMKLRENNSGQGNGKYFKQRSKDKPGFRPTVTIDANGDEADN